jgi:hypothetical protein
VFATDSTISGNSTLGDRSYGGGSETGAGNITLMNTTVSGHSTHGNSAHGGGISTKGATIRHSTITTNRVAGTNSKGGGISQDDNELIALDHAILSGNTSSGIAADFFNRVEFNADFSVLGEVAYFDDGEIGEGNVRTLEPMLHPLGDNGGATLTHEPMEDSPAIDAGDPAVANNPEFDQRGNGFERIVDTIDIGSVEIQIVDALACDFDSDGLCSGSDIDLLQENIVSGLADPATFDLTSDGLVNIADRDAWLSEAGAENLSSGNPYQVGDANLDGAVDTSDFNLWNANKFTANSAWTAADFSADGSVDTSDFNLWNASKFTSADAVNRNSLTRNSDDLKDDETQVNRIDSVFAGRLVI